MLQFQKGKTPKRYPLFQIGSQLVEDKTFRPANDNHRASNFALRAYEMLRVRVAKTGDGSEILLWGEHGHELSKGESEPAGEGIATRLLSVFRKSAPPSSADASHYRRTFTLLAPVEGTTWTSVPAGQDGLFYLANRCLYEIHRGGDSIPHLPKLTNIMEIRPGPEGSLLLREGDNKAGDWGKFYWPQTKELAHLKPDLLPDVGPSTPLAFYWLEQKRRLLAFTAQEVWFIPREELQELPRLKV